MQNLLICLLCVFFEKTRQLGLLEIHKEMIVLYLSDIAIYCKLQLFSFFPHRLVPPQRAGRNAPLSHLPACNPCSGFTSPRSKELQGFELQPQLKDNAAAVACHFENWKPLLFLKGTLTWQGAGLSLSCSFVFLLKSKAASHFFYFFEGPNQHAAALVVDCRGVNCALFL